MGVVYHARYLVWLDVARCEHLRRTGLSYRELEERGYRMVVGRARACATCAGPATTTRCGSAAGFAKSPRRKVVFGYAVDRMSDGELLVTATTTMFVLDAGHAARPAPERRGLLARLPPPTRSGSTDAYSSRSSLCCRSCRALRAGAGQRLRRGPGARPRPPRMPASGMTPVLRRGVTFADTVVRSRTALAIGRIGDPQGLPLLLTLLEDPEDNVRPSARLRPGTAARHHGRGPAHPHALR